MRSGHDQVKQYGSCTRWGVIVELWHALLALQPMAEELRCNANAVEHREATIVAVSRLQGHGLAWTNFHSVGGRVRARGKMRVDKKEGG